MDSNSGSTISEYNVFIGHLTVGSLIHIYLPQHCAILGVTYADQNLTLQVWKDNDSPSEDHERTFIISKVGYSMQYDSTTAILHCGFNHGGVAHFLVEVFDSEEN